MRKRFYRVLVALSMTAILIVGASACGNNASESETFPSETESTEEPATESEEEIESESTEEVESEVETKVEDGEYKIYPSFVTTFELEDNILTIGTEDVFEDFPIPKDMAINFAYPLAEDFEWSDSTSVGSEDDVDWYEWFSFYWEGITMSVDRYLDGQYGDYYTSGEDFCKKNAVWIIVIKDEKVVSISMDLDNADTEKSETAQESKAESSTKPTDTKESKTNNSSKTAESTSTPTHEHSYTSSVTQNPTCTTQGVRTFVCNGCGSSYTENIPCTEHNWKERVDEIYHEAQGEWRDILVSEGSGDVYVCNYCGSEHSSSPDIMNHYRSYVGTDNAHATSSYTIRSNEPTYSQEWVELSPAWTEEIVTYECSTCGATK